MPLSFFQYDPPRHYSEVVGQSDSYGHTFGGVPSSFGLEFVNCEPLHLLYRLNQADSAVTIGLPGIHWLPLCYHFWYSSFDDQLIYRVRSDTQVELIAPLDAPRDPHFPKKNFPASFPSSGAAFRKEPYDPTAAEDALRLAAVFGFDQLTEPEMQEAITIANKTSSTISDWELPDWTPEDILRWAHPEPFIQGAPLKSCRNPDCSAEIAYRTEEMTVAIHDENFRELTGQSSLTLEARDVRKDSLRVFAVHQPDDGDDHMWPGIQLIFQVCEVCHCIRVTNQCT